MDPPIQQNMPNDGIPANANMYNQLETMMRAIKKEAEGLEKLKAKLRDMDDLKNRNADLKQNYKQ